MSNNNSNNTEVYSTHVISAVDRVRNRTASERKVRGQKKTSFTEQDINLMNHFKKVQKFI